MIIDLHCDTIEKAYDEKLKLDNKKLSFNIIDAKENMPYIQCLATFVHSKYEQENNGFKRANEIIDNFYNICNFRNIKIIKKKEDIFSKELKKKVGVILTIENGTAISHDLDNIEKLYKKGIRMMGVTWNYDNKLACGALTKNDKGLTSLGKKYIKKLEQQKIIIDISHVSKKSFYDICKISKKPIIASHSCVKSICSHPRNLDDNQIKQIAKRKGVIGICFSKSFLTKKSNANVIDIVSHINYIVNLVGIDYVSFGSDFDGLEEENILKDISGVKDYRKIIKELKKYGYKKEEIEKISYKNFLRVVNEIL